VLYLYQKINSSGKLPKPIYDELISPAIDVAFSSEWARNQTNKLIVNFLDYLKNNREDLDLKVDFKSRRQILAYEIAGRINNFSEDLHVYGIDLSEKEEAVDILFKDVNLPDSLDLVDSIDAVYPDLIDFINNFREYYGYADYLPYVIYVLIFVLLLIVAGGSLGLKLLGGSMFFAGTLLILLISGTNIWVNNFIIENIPKYDILFTATGTNPLIIATIFKNTIIGTFNKIGAVFCVLGIVLIATAYYIKKITLLKGHSRYHKGI